MVKQIRERKAAQPVASSYPLVAPIWRTRTILLVGLIFASLGLLLMIMGWLNLRPRIREERLLQTEGVVTRAQVTKTDTYDDGEGVSYYVYYTFAASPDDDRWIKVQRQDSVPRDFYYRARSDGEFEVVYVRSNPEIMRIRALYTPGRDLYWGIGFWGGASLLFWLLAWRMFVRYRYARRLDKKGVPVTVRLLNCFKEEDSDGVAFYIVYELPGVGRVKQVVDLGTFYGLLSGGSMRLVYLPDRPKTFRVVESDKV